VGSQTGSSGKKRRARCCSLSCLRPSRQRTRSPPRVASRPAVSLSTRLMFAVIVAANHGMRSSRSHGTGEEGDSSFAPSAIPRQDARRARLVLPGQPWWCRPCWSAASLSVMLLPGVREARSGWRPGKKKRWHNPVGLAITHLMGNPYSLMYRLYPCARI
jgi:hypothetical protein